MDFSKCYIPFDHSVYKYKLIKPYELKIKIRKIISTSYIFLDTNGTLFFQRNYAWDGPSGPTYDTPSFMRGSLVHDGLYQLIREKKLNIKYKKYADKLLRNICLEDGMCICRAYYVYYGVSLFGNLAGKLK